MAEIPDHVAAALHELAHRYYTMDMWDDVDGEVYNLMEAYDKWLKEIGEAAPLCCVPHALEARNA